VAGRGARAWCRRRSSFISRGNMGFRCRLAANADVAADGLVDRSGDGGAVAADAAIRPFDAAIARRDLGLAQNHQAALQAQLANDLVDPFPPPSLPLIPDPDHPLRPPAPIAN